MIVAAAIKYKGVVYAPPAPTRHHDIHHRWPMPEHDKQIQGFIDSEHGFVDRREAAVIANRERQRPDTKHHQPPDVLLSEDAWCRPTS